MVFFSRALRMISVLILLGFLLNVTLFPGLSFFTEVKASTLSSSTEPANKSTISGDYTFKVDDEGDSTRCEMYIDGVLVGYMSNSSGGWDWEMTVGTYAWNDGWHVIRFDAKGGATGDDSKSIYIKFDNDAPTVTGIETIYPSGQTAVKPGDTVTIIGKVTETTSGIRSVVCDTSFISTTPKHLMYDDGNHLDYLSGDGIYGTPQITVTNELIGYHPVYVNATDGAGNYENYPGEVGVDTIDPSIEDVTVIYPKGQHSAKDGDQVRVTAYIDDEDPDVDIVLDIDRSGSMGWTEENKWLFQEIDVSDIADDKSQVKIRFSYESDWSWRASGWNIDDLSLVSDESPSGFFTSNFENTVGNNAWQEVPASDWQISVIPAGLGGSLVDIGYPDPDSAHGGYRIMGVDVTMDGNYENGVSSPKYVESPTINAVGETNVRLRYYRWLNCDFPGTAPDYKSSGSGDEHLVEISNNNGVNWTTIWDNKQQKLEDGKDAAVILVDHQGADDRTALYSFGGIRSITRDQDWTSNKSLIISAINSLNADGGTPLWDSIVAGANYAGTSDTLKALVVLTDGSDTASQNRLINAINAVRANEVPTFTIGLGLNTSEEDLKAVANAYPGGSYYQAASSDQLDEIYADISNAIEKIRFPKGAKFTYVNATMLGGLSKVLMYDDGLHEDFLASDNIYGSELITIATNGETGLIPFWVNVEDVAGRKDVEGSTVLVDNSIISITNSTVIYPANKTNARDGEDIVITASISDPHGIFPPQKPNGIAYVYVDAFNIGASSKVNMYDDGNHSDGNRSDGLFGSEPITVTTGYSIGTYIVMLHAVDNASNTASQQLNVDIDNSGPTSCQLIWPINNMTLEGTVRILASAFDDAGISFVELEIAGSGTWKKMTFNDGEGNYEYYFDTKTLSDGGPYGIKVRAFDNSGDLPSGDELSFGFFVDNTAPVLKLNAPKNDEYIKGVYELNVSYIDPGLFKPMVEYKIDDTEWRSLANTWGSYWTATWDTTEVSDGAHTISFRANDTIGNSVQYSVKVTVDNNSPTCEIVAPVDNEYIQGRYTFRVLALDEVGIKSVSVTFMGVNYSAIYNPQNGYYEYTIDTILIEEGARTLDAIAIDRVGRTDLADQVIFHIDNSAPKLTINDPVPGSFVDGEIFIDVTTSDVYLAISEYKIDGTKWVSTAIPWDTTKVIDGTHTIDIRAYDLLLHETTEQIYVTVDNTEPTIQIHSPSFNQFVEDTFTFKISAWDLIGVDRVEVEFFNQTYFATLNTQTNYYEYTLSSRLYEDDTYDVKATVFDLSGKSRSTGIIQFHIDNTEPTLVLVSPESGDIIKGEFNVEVLSDDVFLDRVEYRIDKGGYLDILTTWNSETLSDGEHIITVRALDEAGHVTTLEFPIIIDNNAPELTFVTPRANEFYSGFMNIRISAFDTVGVDSVLVRLDDEKDPIEIFKNPESGLYEATVDTDDLFDGEHTVYVDVFDNNGFVTSKKLVFYTDNTGPEITIISPGEIDFGEIVFTFNVTDVNGVDLLLLNIDSSGWREITLAALSKVEVSGAEATEITEVYTYNYIWATLPEDNGKHFYVVKAIDTFGNERVVSKEIMVENIIIKVEEEPDYIGMINNLLPIIGFITAVVLIIIILFMFYSGTLQKWHLSGTRRAARGPIKRKKRKKLDVDDEDEFDRGKKKRGPGFGRDYHIDSEYYDGDEYPEEDDDFIRTEETPVGVMGARSKKKMARKRAVRPVRRSSRPSRKLKKEEFDEDGEEISWD